MSPARLLVVVGARPNFVKIGPVWHALAREGRVAIELLNTGQHYDRALAGAFLEQLDLPDPHHTLGVGSGSHAEQTAAVLTGTEAVLRAGHFDAVLVPGDVNSTLAAALAAAKLGVGVIHLEAGLRSGDWSMPEEINRVLTDRLSDLLLCPSHDALPNLEAEGIDTARADVVGNTMIDSLFALLADARTGGTVERHGLKEGGYVLATLHRPALVDEPERLMEVLGVLEALSARLPVVLPLHPRTRATLDRAGATTGGDLRLLEPLEYLDFIAIQAGARLVITDSGGVQEETSALGVPCLTCRDSTERPVTITHGTNELIGLDPRALEAACGRVLDAPMPEVSQIPLWDGAAGPRAAASITRFLADRSA